MFELREKSGSVWVSVVARPRMPRQRMRSSRMLPARWGLVRIASVKARSIGFEIDCRERLLQLAGLFAVQLDQRRPEY